MQFKIKIAILLSGDDTPIITSLLLTNRIAYFYLGTWLAQSLIGQNYLLFRNIFKMSKVQMIKLRDKLFDSQISYTRKEIERFLACFLFYTTRKITYKDISNCLGITACTM